MLHKKRKSKLATTKALTPAVLDTFFFFNIQVPQPDKNSFLQALDYHDQIILNPSRNLTKYNSQNRIHNRTVQKFNQARHNRSIKQTSRILNKNINNIRNP